MTPYGPLLYWLEQAIPYARATGRPLAYVQDLEHTRDVTRATHDKETAK